MNRRIESVRNFLNKSKLDGLLITKQENWQYLSGFTGTDAVVIVTTKENYLITDFRYIEQATEETRDFHIVRPYALVDDAVVDKIKELGIKRLGFESDNITFQNYSSLKAKLPDVEMVPLLQAVENIRWVKDAQELSAIKKAAEIADKAFDSLLKMIKPGVTELELATELEYFMKKNGSEKTSFDTILASGPRGALPHGAASEKKLAKGDFVVIDFGAVYKGYHSDMTRTVVLGPADQKQIEIYNLVLEAQIRAIEAIKPGILCTDIDAVARNLIGSQGYGPNFGHGLGHSVGLEIHEKPAFTPRDKTKLESGMVLTVEPGIYISGWGGVRIEDLVVVTPDGVEILSKTPKQLLEL